MASTDGYGASPTGFTISLSPPRSMSCHRPSRLYYHKTFRLALVFVFALVSHRYRVRLHPTVHFSALLLLLHT